MKVHLTVLLAALLCIAIAPARASANTACATSVLDLPAQALYGSWEAQVEGIPGVATVHLQAHPEYEGVRGTVQRPAQPEAQLAGDINDEGQLNIDESQDGRAISAVWTGQLTPGTCGKAFQGTWRNTADDSDHPFVLRRAGTW